MSSLVSSSSSVSTSVSQNTPSSFGDLSSLGDSKHTNHNVLSGDPDWMSNHERLPRPRPGEGTSRPSSPLPSPPLAEFSSEAGLTEAEAKAQDPLATQIWRLYTRAKDQLPEGSRLENLTWRMMAVKLRRTNSSSISTTSFSSSDPHIPTDPLEGLGLNQGLDPEEGSLKRQKMTAGMTEKMSSSPLPSLSLPLPPLTPPVETEAHRSLMSAHPPSAPHSTLLPDMRTHSSTPFTNPTSDTTMGEAGVPTHPSSSSSSPSLSPTDPSTLVSSMIPSLYGSINIPSDHTHHPPGTLGGKEEGLSKAPGKLDIMPDDHSWPKVTFADPSTHLAYALMSSGGTTPPADYVPGGEEINPFTSLAPSSHEEGEGGGGTHGHGKAHEDPWGTHQLARASLSAFDALTFSPMFAPWSATLPIPSTQASGLIHPPSRITQIPVKDTTSLIHPSPMPSNLPSLNTDQESSTTAPTSSDPPPSSSQDHPRLHERPPRKTMDVARPPPKDQHDAALPDGVGPCPPKPEEELTCMNCSTSKTPLWRRDTSGRNLCNACGLFLRLHGRERPLSLKREGGPRKRNRSEKRRVPFPMQRRIERAALQPKDGQIRPGAGAAILSHPVPRPGPLHPFAMPGGPLSLGGGFSSSSLEHQASTAPWTQRLDMWRELAARELALRRQEGSL